jgi:hypothetical protein
MSKPPVDDEPVVATLTDAEPLTASASPMKAPATLVSSVERSLYEIQGEHARGGLGRILRARDCRLDRTVAIKELLGDGFQAARRFDREATLTARLQHPAIVPVHEFGRWEDGRAFYAMKLIDGRPLKDIIAELPGTGDRLGLLPMVIQVVEAVAYAHECGIIHRDLKPSNIMVGKHGEVVVVDWGLAKDLSDTEEAPTESPYRSTQEGDLTSYGAVLGTPAYMPPEQARGAEADRRSDVYSLGAILFHLLSGRAPFTGKPSDIILEQVIATDAPFELLAAARIPLDLAAIVRKAMARDPELRYQTAADLADDLKRFQTGRLVAVHEYSWRLLAKRWIARNTALTWAIAISVVLLIATMGFSFSRILHERNTARMARVEAEAQSSALILGRAQASLKDDPTSAIGWLKIYLKRQGSIDLVAARDVAAEAESKGVALVELRGHSHYVLDVAFADDNHLLSTSKDGTLRGWDLRTGSSRVIRRTGGMSGIWRIPGRGYAYLARGGKLAIPTSNSTAMSFSKDRTVGFTNVLPPMTARSWESVIAEAHY